MQLQLFILFYFLLTETSQKGSWSWHTGGIYLLGTVHLSSSIGGTSTVVTPPAGGRIWSVISFGLLSQMANLLVYTSSTQCILLSHDLKLNTMSSNWHCKKRFNKQFNTKNTISKMSYPQLTSSLVIITSWLLFDSFFSCLSLGRTFVPCTLQWARTHTHTHTHTHTGCKRYPAHVWTENTRIKANYKVQLPFLFLARIKRSPEPTFLFRIMLPPL